MTGPVWSCSFPAGVIPALAVLRDHQVGTETELAIDQRPKRSSIECNLSSLDAPERMVGAPPAWQ